jgi:hypothetical protein
LDCSIAQAAALRRLVEDARTRKQLVINARRRMAERFAPEAQIAKTGVVLAQIKKGPGVAAGL